jgi:hypothetical protein
MRRDLEAELRALPVDWPPTPDLAAAVADRLDRPAAPRRRRFRAALVALAVLVGGAMAVEPARSAILELLGLRSVRIERREPVATVQPPLGAGLGARVDQAEALRRADFRPAPPAVLGEPLAVLYAEPPPGGMVSYLYDGLLVSELIATATPVIGKAAGSGTRVEQVRVGGARGYWLSGRPHGFAYVDRDGAATFADQRLAGPTLLLERGGLLLRIEGRVTKARALAIARSIPARP